MSKQMNRIMSGWVDKKTYYCLLAICYLLLATCFLNGCDSKAKQQKVKIGDKAPEFVLYDIEGSQQRLSDHGGRIVVIRFWADWCPSCREEMPMLDRVYREKRESGLAILAINVKQPKVIAEEFAKNLKLTYPILIDEDARVAKTYGVMGLPTTFVVDKAGIVREKILGELDEQAIRKLLGVV